MISAARARAMKVKAAETESVYTGEVRQKISDGIARAIKKLDAAIQERSKTSNSIEVRFQNPTTEGEKAVYEGTLSTLRNAGYEVMVVEAKLTTGIGFLDMLAEVVGANIAFDVTISW